MNKAVTKPGVKCECGAINHYPILADGSCRLCGARLNGTDVAKQIAEIDARNLLAILVAHFGLPDVYARSAVSMVAGWLEQRDAKRDKERQQ